MHRNWPSLLISLVLLSFIFLYTILYTKLIKKKEMYQKKSLNSKRKCVSLYTFAQYRPEINNLLLFITVPRERGGVRDYSYLWMWTFTSLHIVTIMTMPKWTSTDTWVHIYICLQWLLFNKNRNSYDQFKVLIAGHVLPGFI